MSKNLTDGLLVGLEIHQQLACDTKLFCACPPVKSEELPYSFERRLRPAQSETGRLDPAAVFEYSKGKSNRYFWNPESSCLVEADEEPPHPLSREGLDSAILTAKILGSELVDEVHVMRKIVIDGSNTSGFQRTAIIGLGGVMNVGGTAVGVQSVTIEEDAARILGQDEGSRLFALDRLGVALVEVALDPVKGDPEFVGRVALHLGRVLRSTGRVARGLGTIRQDLNVSLAGGRVVEVKGVQRLNLLPRVVEYERGRQRAMIRVSEGLKKKGVRRIRCGTFDVTKILESARPKAIREGLEKGGKVAAIRATGLAGLLGWEPLPGFRLGREVAEVARANSLGGVIHSDEFERQGITPEETAALRQATKSGVEDGLVLLAGPSALVDRCVPLLIERLQQAVDGVPAETRAATESGETRYMRPRPGSQRMYPETDIPNIPITSESIPRLAQVVPEDWETRVARLARRYSLSNDLALKLYDSELDEAFERLSGELRVEPSVIASVLADVPPRLRREGVPDSALTLEALTDVLRAVSEGRAAKEAIPDILKAVGTKSLSVSDAIGSLGLGAAGESEILAVVDSLLRRKAGLVAERKESAFSPLMGEAMKELRGRADGAAVGRILKERLKAAVRNAQSSE